MTVRNGIAYEPEAGTGAGFDRLGVLIAGLCFYAALFAPLMTLRANRIVPGEARMLWEALPAPASLLLGAFVLTASVVALLPVAVRSLGE